MKDRFIALYNSESDAIFRYCYLRTSDREIAIDLAQDTFVKFWAALSGGKVIRSDRALLFAIAKNLIIDWYRKKKPISIEAIAEEAESDIDSTPFFSDHGALMNIELAAEGRFLLKQISLLDPIYQEAVYLRYVGGLSPREIGEIIGVSANAATVRVSRGLEKLKKIVRFENNRDENRKL